MKKPAALSNDDMLTCIKALMHDYNETIATALDLSSNNLATDSDGTFELSIVIDGYSEDQDYRTARKTLSYRENTEYLRDIAERITKTPTSISVMYKQHERMPLEAKPILERFDELKEMYED